MSGKFQPAKSDYNKDETFAKFSIDETVKVTLSEAIAKDSGDNSITVYGWVELPLVGVDLIGNMTWVYEPQLCKFSIPKKDYETEYNGKKNSIKQTPGMKAAVHLISTYGYDKPFSGMFDFGVALPVAESLISGKNDKGGDLTAAELAMIGSYFMRLEPLEKLDKLEGKEIKEQGRNGGYRGGGGGQKESEKLKERLEFIKTQMLADSDLAMVCYSLYGEKGNERQIGFIEDMLQRLFG